MSDSTLTADQIRARIAALQASRDAGVLRVRHGNTDVQYQSVEDMNKVLAALQAQLDALEGNTVRPRVNYIRQDSKGFGTCDTGGTSNGWEFT